MGQQDPGKKPKGLEYKPQAFTSYQGGNLTFNPIQYTQNQDYKDSLKNIGLMINAPQAENPYLTQGNAAFGRIMDPNYKAYSEDDINRQYEMGKEKLSDEWFKQNRQMAARQAATGMTGSGTGGTQWNALNKNQTKELSEFYQNLQDKNTEATRQDKAQALSSVPQMASLINQIGQQGLQNQIAWNSLLGNENQMQNQFNQFNAGQQNQANQANWQRAWDNWQAQNQWNQWNTGNQMQADMFNKDKAWQAYLQQLQNNKDNSFWGIVGDIAGGLLPG